MYMYVHVSVFFVGLNLQFFLFVGWGKFSDAPNLQFFLKPIFFFETYKFFETYEFLLEDPLREPLTNTPRCDDLFVVFGAQK